MLDSITTVLQAIWQQDFTALHAPGIALSIYVCIFSFIFLESALLPAAPLPCDSVVILSGTLAAMGILNPLLVYLLLFVAAAGGSYLAFVQGRLLNRLPRVQGWVYKVPPDSLAAVDKLLGRHGLVALFFLCPFPAAGAFAAAFGDGRAHGLYQDLLFFCGSECLLLGGAVGIAGLYDAVSAGADQQAVDHGVDGGAGDYSGAGARQLADL
ncbi:hypothetical protein KE622_04600 [Shewanella algae]|uniref:DedA family protein n=1 Tax=Shewanella algae TaxID=38313 RepID=UPI001C4C120B|nr:hypothetical protein [Shewanella algae]QXP21018.1 hypothetical protein KE621_09840 [Shewanella algae]QXP30695.1 hypothetical protein KE622_04600 [Shewanella algae]QXP36038.1 hypothetical protein KE623_11010 [Shewanella algae]QXP39836.1 hypothetical protein KE624_09435 [Shewanella algae]